MAPLGSRVALEAFEVDHRCRSRDPYVGRKAVFDLSHHRDSHGLEIVLAAPIGTTTGKPQHRCTLQVGYLATFRLTPV